MSNPLPPLAPPPPRRGPPPGSIDPILYPALEQLREHCTCGGVMLIDRVYAEAQMLLERVREAEAQLLGEELL